MSRFEISRTPLKGVVSIKRKLIGDERGFLSRIYSDDELADYGFSDGISQINHTLTRKRGAVRGMHFQYPPHAETKLVSCIKGSVFDVAVDLRKGSPTFLKWYGEILSADNNTALLIPQGFAHGFQALEGDCELIYLHSAAYEPQAEGGLDVLDPKLGIAWPLPVSELSARDEGHAMLDGEFTGVVL